MFVFLLSAAVMCFMIGVVIGISLASYLYVAKRYGGILNVITSEEDNPALYLQLAIDTEELKKWKFVILKVAKKSISHK